MGAVCSTDKYKQIKEKYGLQLTKLIIGEKNKQFLDRIITKLRKQISEYAVRYETNCLQQLKEEELVISQYYKKVRKQLDQRQPGGIKSLEQMSSKSVQDLLGYNYIMQLFLDLRENIMMRFKSEQNQMLDELLEIKMSQEELSYEEKPNLTIYNDMLDEQKDVVMKKGEMEFHEILMQYQELLLAEHGDKLDKQYYITRFQNIQTKEALNNIAFISKDKLVTSLNLILSQRVSSYIFMEKE